MKNRRVKQNSSVFVAIFTQNERDGWIAPGMIGFIVGLSSTGRKVQLQVRDNVKPIDYARNVAVKDFLASDAQWLLMIDNDMGPQPNLLDMLDRAKERMKILVPKFFLLAPCLAKYSHHPKLPLSFGWQPLNKMPKENEWSELAWSGTGTMFVHRSVFERMGSEGWFRFSYDANGAMLNSEDVSFCQKARKL